MDSFSTFAGSNGNDSQLLNEEDVEMMYGWQTNAFTDNHHVIISENYLIFVILLVCSLLLQYMLNACSVQVIPSSAATILLSMLIGFGIRILDSAMIGPTPIFLDFSTEVFYFGLLPPIIFNSGYHLRRIVFYKNIDAILSLAFLGTFGSIIILASGIYYCTNFVGLFISSRLQFNMMESIAFGALLSSTDPVATLSIYQRLGIETNLYYLVFGESVLNDAVAITVYKLSSNFIIRTPSDPWIPVFMLINFIIIFIGSSFIGYLCGLLLALVFKFFDFPKDKISPMALTLCSAYLPFFLAEALQLSGIVAIFFAGISTRRYVMKNTKGSIKIISASIFESISYLAETTCFIIMGLAMVLQDFHYSRKEVICFISLTFVLCVLARMINVYGLLGLVNFKRILNQHGTIDSNKEENPKAIPINYMTMVFMAGLRGAVAYALAYDFNDFHNHRSLVIGSTSVVILLTVLLLGGLTNPLISLLNIPTTNKYSALKEDPNHGTINDKLDQVEKHFQDFESQYLYPMFVKNSSYGKHHRRPESIDKLTAVPSEQSSYKNQLLQIHNKENAGVDHNRLASMEEENGKEDDENHQTGIMLERLEENAADYGEESSGGGSVDDIPDEWLHFSPPHGRFLRSPQRWASPNNRNNFC